MRRIPSLAACLAGLALAGCFAIGNSGVPIDTLSVAAPRPPAERTLVIVLPGIGSDAREMKDRGIADAIHASWPEADILLTSATLAYYRDGKLVPRLHREIVEPARKSGYARVWLAGASLGGMGALVYEREHPGEVTGIALFAPFLGNADLLEEIRSAGGPGNWEPVPLPAGMNGDHYQRQVWRMVKSWADRPRLARCIWLAVGTRDRFAEGARLIEPVLPGTHYLELPGGHTWNCGAARQEKSFRASAASPLKGDPRQRPCNR
ncbi:MAG: alpha/beta hydrolase-fold protein [Burkholderiales bacterium]